MKTTEENSSGLTNKSNSSLGKKEDDKKTPGRSSGEVSNEKEDIEGLNKGNNLGKGMTLDKKRLEGEVDKETGGITGESKSIHVEDWENDPFAAQSQEDNVRAEFALRKNKNLGNDKGVENTETEGEGRSMGSGPDTKKYNREDESGESGV